MSCPQTCPKTRPIAVAIAAVAITAAVPVAAMFVAAVFVAPVAAAAAQHPAHPVPRHVARAPSNGPKLLGKYDDWMAATRSEAGETICFAFARPKTSAPLVPGRGDTVLTVTQRKHERDVVALSAGFQFPPNAEVTATVDKAELHFYTKGRSAFSGDGKPVLAAFANGRKALFKSPGPHNATVVDTFGLRGFSAAYAAIDKACPPG